VGIVAGTGAGLLLMLLSGVHIAPAAWVLAAAGLVAAVGLWDDVSPLTPGVRLAVQVGAAIGVVWMCGGLVRLPLPAPLDVPLGWAGVPVAILWMVAVTNFFNFMDGADGLAGGQAVITLCVIAWLTSPHVVGAAAVIVIAATLAFLVRNWAPAKIFLGDAGSGWLGFTMAALPFAAPVVQRESLVFVAGTSLALFLADPLITLIRRTTQGKPIAAAHREHAYQRLIRPDRSHALPVAGILVGGVVLAVLAVLAGPEAERAWMVVGGVVALVVIEQWLAD
jgi:UDP-N-acetylmuramyl pentapeptide phosphotransferase/UDP-N-acetylglucosamine-1-phosphate transferase